MTPALKAMVEAMAAEIVRQGNEEKSRGTAVWYPSDPTNPADVRSISLDGDIDLEKVARAGLEAIRWPEDTEAQVDIILAGADVPDSVQRFWPPMIDAILKDDPTATY